MSKRRSLAEIIAVIDSFAEDLTIYAVEPWTGNSEAVVLPQLETGRPPDEATIGGLSYFLEVDIARDLIRDLSASLTQTPSAGQICDRVIQYAINDA